MARRLEFNASAEYASEISDNYDKRLEQALAERDQFLAAHPDCVPYQRQIDRILSKAGPPEIRMSVLALMIEAKLNELTFHFRDLADMLNEQATHQQWALGKIH